MFTDFGDGVVEGAVHVGTGTAGHTPILRMVFPEAAVHEVVGFFGGMDVVHAHGDPRGYVLRAAAVDPDGVGIKVVVVKIFSVLDPASANPSAIISGFTRYRLGAVVRVAVPDGFAGIAAKVGTHGVGV